MDKNLHIFTSAITLMAQEATANHRSVLKSFDDLRPADAARQALLNLQDPAHDDAIRRIVKACGGEKAHDLLEWAEAQRSIEKAHDYYRTQNGKQVHVGGYQGRARAASAKAMAMSKAANHDESHAKAGEAHKEAMNAHQEAIHAIEDQAGSKSPHDPEVAPHYEAMEAHRAKMDEHDKAGGARHHEANLARKREDDAKNAAGFLAMFNPQGNR